MNALDNPQTYANPDLTADLVMKGGITSGIVFPRAICELARRYRFHHIGGTSAGAIAAGVAAAAEHGRSQGNPASFVDLAGLPSELGERGPGTRPSRLLQLFQPAPNLRPLFELLLALISGERPAEKIAQTLRLMLLRFGARPWLGMIPGLVLLALWLVFPPQGVVGNLLSAVAVLLVTALGLLVGSVLVLGGKVLREVPENLFGICTGNHEDEGDAPALTPWLHQRIQELAGRDPETDDPLTFGDLEAPGSQHPVALRVMTTCLTLGRSYLLPFDTGIFYFGPRELRRLFPETVVRYMEREAERWSRSDEPSRTDYRTNRYMYPRLPLPAGKMPIVVAVRMSLSFPLLLSAVPLWTIDWSRKSNQQARTAWREWIRSHQNDWAALEKRPDLEAPAEAPAVKPEAERVWFSDGGICSNFPVHLFDTLLPDAPTFAINLKYSKAAKGETDRIELAKTAGSGLLEAWSRFADGPEEGAGSLLKFLGSILGTMQNWADNSMLKIPGYRDRIVHLHLAPEEGGLNLDMTPEQIGRLSGWGQEAGAELLERYTRTTAQRTELSWDTHRWTRLRSSLAFFQRVVEDLVETYRGSGHDGWRSYEELIRKGEQEHPTSYRWARKIQPDLAIETFEILGKLADRWTEEDPGLHDRRVPNPQPKLHIRPPLQK